jgi:hypothetical protein
MSNFLVRLACRSAGIAPVLRPERQLVPMPPVERIAEASMLADLSVSAPAGLAASEAPLRDSPMAARASSEAAADTRAPFAALPVAPTAVAPALVQRSIAASVAPVVVASGMAMPPSVSPASPPPRANPWPAPDAPAPMPMHPSHAALHTTQTGEIRTERVIEVRTPAAPTHDAPPPIAVSSPIRPSLASAADVIVADAPDAHESVAAPPASALLQAAPAARDTAPLPAPFAAAAAVERVVQVHIGAIEIRGATPEAPRAPQEASAPAGHSEPVQAGIAASGGFDAFDAYTSLRSYAPWTW